MRGNESANDRMNVIIEIDRYYIILKDRNKFKNDEKRTEKKLKKNKIEIKQ